LDNYEKQLKIKMKLALASLFVGSAAAYAPSS